MKIPILAISTGALLVSACGSSAGVSLQEVIDAETAPLESFSTSYTGRVDGALVAQPIDGFEPEADGGYPVLLFMTGTFGRNTIPTSMAFVHRAAARGFVAGSVDYENTARFGCGVMRDKAAAVYSDTFAADNAIEVLCSRPKADCSKGIVVAGHSQGSFMAILAGDYDPRVRAVAALGTGYDLALGADMERCLVDERQLPAARILGINGQADHTFGGALAAVSQLNELAARSCDTSDFECLDEASAQGWIRVRHAQVADGHADHCFMMHDRCASKEIDPHWVWGSDAFSLDATLAFLGIHVDR